MLHHWLDSHVEKRIILHDMNYWDNSEFIFNVFHGTFNNLTRVYKHKFQSGFFFIPWRFNQCHIVSYFYCPFFVLYCDSLEVYSALCVCRITWCYQSQWCETVFPAPLHSESHQRRTPGTHQGRAFHHLQGTEILAARLIRFNTPDSSVYQHHGYLCNNILTGKTGCHHSQHHKCIQYNLKLIN